VYGEKSGIVQIDSRIHKLEKIQNGAKILTKNYTILHPSGEIETHFQYNMTKSSSV